MEKFEVCHPVAVHSLMAVQDSRNVWLTEDINTLIRCKRGMSWRSWLRHFATSRKVAGSITDGITGVSHGSMSQLSRIRSHYQQTARLWKSLKCATLLLYTA